MQARDGLGMPAGPGRPGWAGLLVAILAFAVAAFSLRYLLPNSPAAPLVVSRNPFAVPWLAVHATLAALALAVGPLQFWAPVRQRGWHRVLGRVYVGCCLLSAPAGLLLAFGATTGPVSTAGFGSLAVVWFATTLVGYKAALDRRFEVHRGWMVRSYALTFAAVTLRLYLGVVLATHMDFDTAYRAISFLAWVPNLVVVELLLRRGRIGIGSLPTRRPAPTGVPGWNIPTTAPAGDDGLRLSRGSGRAERWSRGRRLRRWARPEHGRSGTARRPGSSASTNPAAKPAAPPAAARSRCRGFPACSPAVLRWPEGLGRGSPVRSAELRPRGRRSALERVRARTECRTRWRTPGAGQAEHPHGPETAVHQGLAGPHGDLPEAEIETLPQQRALHQVMIADRGAAERDQNVGLALPGGQDARTEGFETVAPRCRDRP